MANLNSAPDRWEESGNYVYIGYTDSFIDNIGQDVWTIKRIDTANGIMQIADGAWTKRHTLFDNHFINNPSNTFLGGPRDVNNNGYDGMPRAIYDRIIDVKPNFVITDQSTYPRTFKYEEVEGSDPLIRLAVGPLGNKWDIDDPIVENDDTLARQS